MEVHNRVHPRIEQLAPLLQAPADGLAGQLLIMTVANAVGVR